MDHNYAREITFVGLRLSNLKILTIWFELFPHFWGPEGSVQWVFPRWTVRGERSTCRRRWGIHTCRGDMLYVRDIKQRGETYRVKTTYIHAHRHPLVWVPSHRTMLPPSCFFFSTFSPRRPATVSNGAAGDPNDQTADGSAEDARRVEEVNGLLAERPAPGPLGMEKRNDPTPSPPLQPSPPPSHETLVAGDEEGPQPPPPSLRRNLRGGVSGSLATTAINAFPSFLPMPFGNCPEVVRVAKGFWLGVSRFFGISWFVNGHYYTVHGNNSNYMNNTAVKRVAWCFCMWSYHWDHWDS